MGIFPFFVVFDPEHLQTILGSAKHTEKSFFYKLLHNFLGDGLITSSGKKWSVHRKYLQPTFHKTILEKFIGTFAESAQCLHEKLSNHEQINITSVINECVLDILNGEISRSFELWKNFFMNFSFQSQYSAFQLVAISQTWKILHSDSEFNFF
jgi:cytochrome P450